MLSLGIGLWSNVAASGGGGGAPVLSSPTGTKTSTTAATIGVTTNTGNGTLYWVVTVSGTAPTAAQVKAGQDNSGTGATASGSQAVSSTGAKTASPTGLTAATSYYAHFMHENTTPAQSAVVSSNQFLGAEIVVNGDFSASTGWTLTNATISGGVLNVSAAAGYAAFQANAGIVSGHTYQLTFTIPSYTSGSVAVYVGSTGTALGSARSSVGTFTTSGTADSSNEIGFQFAGGGFTGTIDNYSVKEVL